MSDETPSGGQAAHDDMQDTATLRVGLLGKQFDFRYPNSLYMQNVAVGIFKGEEYPILPLSNFAPTTIVDVGANIGATALYFHNAYPQARIYCYEPSQENFRCLKANASHFADKIQVFPYGLLDRDCQLPMYRGTSQSGQNSLAPNSETTASPTETVRLVKASREAAERGWNSLSILKLDTEGCEVPILTELLSSVRTIDLLYCEYHSEEDRRHIDLILADRFVLCGSKSDAMHLGTCIYLSRSFVAEHPEIDACRKSIRPQTGL
jgi:FkbM family methyltransferase